MCVGLGNAFTEDFLDYFLSGRLRRLHRLILRLYFRRVRVCRVILRAEEAELAASRVDVCDCRLLLKRCAHRLDYCYKLDEKVKDAPPPPYDLVAMSADAPQRGLVRLRVETLGKRIEHCHCCRCCCQALIVERLAGPGLLLPGDEVPETALACLRCGKCAAACPLNARSAGKTDLRRCVGCGLCLLACRRDAIRMRPAAERPERLPRRNPILANALALGILVYVGLVQRSYKRGLPQRRGSGRL